jgi:glycosyltransferase involved in cell wall biosynthesis
MKIAYIAAGAAGMYCGSCLRDNAVARELMRLGEDVLLLPLYTPLRLERDDVQSPAVFYGGISIYLQQKFAYFRKRRAIDRLLDSPRLLRLTNYLAGSTNAADLGELTVSTLRGDEGFQRKELERLSHWLASEFRPDLINLPNSMFVGAARMLKGATGAPVVCSLTGEDLFLDDLREPYRTEALATLRARAPEVDRFIATSAYYAEHMAEVLAVDRERIDVVPLGLDAEGFPDAQAAPERPFTVGYLARLAPEKGFHLLAEAFEKLKRMPGTEDARLVAAGFVSAKDRGFVRETLEGLKRAGVGSDVEYRGEVTFEEKLGLLSDVDVLSVPTVYREPKGLFVLEALAAGVPVVQPAHGAFPEILEATGGGELFPPGDTTALAERLNALALDAPRRRALGEAGARAVRERFTAAEMGRKTREAYQHALTA